MTEKRLSIWLSEIFYVLTGGLCLFVLLEAIKPGLVFAYINLNLLLLAWLLIGILLLVVINKDAI
jgi:hypothetical protein